MRFRVIGSDGKYKMQTEYKSCVYDLDTLRSMERAGFKFTLDGETLTAEEIPAAIKKAKDVVVKIPKGVSTNLDDIDEVDVSESEVPVEPKKPEASSLKAADSNKFIVKWKLCKRAKKYDEVEEKQKIVETLQSAKEFLDIKSEKTHSSYWAGGSIETEDGTVVHTVSI